MATLVPAFAALFAIVPLTGAGAASVVPVPPGASATGATRFSGAAAVATVSARIIRGSARVGAGLGPPAPAMVPRRATIAAADGTPVAALVYDFE